MKLFETVFDCCYADDNQLLERKYPIGAINVEKDQENRSIFYYIV